MTHKIVSGDNLYYKNIYYLKRGIGTKNIIFLHGWGGDSNQFLAFSNLFLNNYNVYLLDLPAFGKSYTDAVLSLEDYGNAIDDFIKGNKIFNPIIIGHSFGGRIALKMLESNMNYKTILISTPGFDLKSLKTRIKLMLNKMFNVKFPSKDYKNANQLRRKIMNRCMLDTKKIDYKKITQNLIIIHGTKDKTVKPRVAKKMNKKIKKSHLIWIKGEHFPYLDEPVKVYKVINYYANI